MPEYGCSLDDAFKTQEQPKETPKPKTKKKKSSGLSAPVLPPAEYIDFTQLGGDPDRQQWVRPKLIEAMNTEKPSWFGSTDAVEPSEFMKSLKAAEQFADYNPSDSATTNSGLSDDGIGADFMSAFRDRGVQKASAVPAQPPISDIWKPLTPAGAETAFFNYLPQLQSQPDGRGVDHDALQRRLKSIYERLDTLETAKRDNSNKEVMLFVMSGVFFLFSLDLITRISK
jgi:hypothetical protein